MMPPKKNHKALSADKAYLNQIIMTQARLAEASFDLKTFLDLVVHQMQNLTPATGVVIELVDGKDMVYQAATGSVAQYIGLRLPIGNSISGLCVHNHEILQSNDTERDPRVNLAACRKIQARSLVVAPLFHNGNAVGVLKILSKKPKTFGKQHIQTLQLMAGFIGSALAHQITYQATEKLLLDKIQALTKSKKSEKYLQHIAHYDFLTGLTNRKLFSDLLKVVLSHTKRTNKLIALMYLDIDAFKTINDNLGHGAGDALLKAFAKRLKNCIRSSDIVGRLGGDEFAILLEEVKKPQNAIKIAEKILTNISKAFKIDNQLIKITASIGIAFYQEGKINNAIFMKQADQALYKAKQAGKNRFEIFQV